jgi:hypothetical protein
MSNYDPLYEVKGGELLLRGIKNDVLPDCSVFDRRSLYERQSRIRTGTA